MGVHKLTTDLTFISFVKKIIKAVNISITMVRLFHILKTGPHFWQSKMMFQTWIIFENYKWVFLMRDSLTDFKNSGGHLGNCSPFLCLAIHLIVFWPPCLWA